jgi:hypothetical protein
MATYTSLAPALFSRQREERGFVAEKCTVVCHTSFQGALKSMALGLEGTWVLGAWVIPGKTFDIPYIFRT